MLRETLLRSESRRSNSRVRWGILSRSGRRGVAMLDPSPGQAVADRRVDPEKADESGHQALLTMIPSRTLATSSQVSVARSIDSSTSLCLMSRMGSVSVLNRRAMAS